MASPNARVANAAAYDGSASYSGLFRKQFDPADRSANPKGLAALPGLISKGLGALTPDNLFQGAPSKNLSDQDSLNQSMGLNF